MQKRNGRMALPSRGGQGGRRPVSDIKKGPLENERPKSREETPKVGYDTSGIDPDMSLIRHMGLFVVQRNYRGV